MPLMTGVMPSNVRAPRKEPRDLPYPPPPLEAEKHVADRLEVIPL